MSKNLPAIRDVNGLSPSENSLLQEIALTGSWEEAADHMNMTRRAARNMLALPHVKAQYDVMFGEEEALTRRELSILSSEIPTLLTQAKDAETSKTLTCPHCKHVFTITLINWAAKLKAVEMLSKMTGFLTDRKQVEVKGGVTNINVQLTSTEYLALQQLRMGVPVPAHIYAALQGKVPASDLPPMPANSAIIEGEFSELPDKKEG